MHVDIALEIEVQFYCLMPLLASIFLVSDKRIRRGLLLADCYEEFPISPLWDCVGIPA